MIPTVYLVVFAVASLKKPKIVESSDSPVLNRIAILIPAYKEDRVIEDCVRSCANQIYPKDYFKIVVIADSMQGDTLEKISILPIDIVIIENEERTKSYAINEGLKGLKDFDIALILDADNLLESDFLEKINIAFNQGWEVVQAHRVPKNRDTRIALLDGISEEINNSIFRKGHYNLGLSAALVGSGMAFRFNHFQRIMSQMKAVGGFDKELEFIYLSEKVRIHYLHDAYVYDEKIQQVEGFSNQRLRWLSAQLYYAEKFIKMSYIWFRQRNIDILDKLFQMILPPRVIFLGILFIFTIISIIIDAGKSAKWLVLMILLIFSLVISIPRKDIKRDLIPALISIPRIFWEYSKNLFRLKGANKKFIHTRHG